MNFFQLEPYNSVNNFQIKDIHFYKFYMYAVSFVRGALDKNNNAFN